MAQTLNKHYLSLTDRLNQWLTGILSQPITIPLCLLLITLSGAFLRVYKLGEWSFWGDEMFTVSGREDGFNYSWFRQSISSLLIQSNTAMNGVSEWNARIVPAIIGIATIPALFFIVKKLVDVPTGILAALLLALSPWHLYWSQNARFYTALLFFYSLALFFFYIGMEYDKPWHFVLCLIFLGLATKERLLALFFLPVILVYVILLHILAYKKPKGWRYRSLVIFLVPALLGGLLFVGPYVLNFSAWMSGFGFSTNSPFWLAGGFAFYVGLPVVCLSIVGGTYLLLQKNRAGLLLSVSAVLPILLLLLIAPFHYTASRYAFISLTSLLVLAAISLTTLIKQAHWPTKLLALGALLILIVHPLQEDAMYYLHQNGNRDNWKAAFSYVQQHMQPSDKAASANRALTQYYLAAEFISFEEMDLHEIETQDQRIWFVEDMTSIQKFPRLHTWLSQNAQLVSIHDITFQARTYSMRVYFYDPQQSRDAERADDAKQ
jgi:hypothetical protein